MTDNSLFRAHAVNSQIQSLYGDVILIKSYSSWFIVFFLSSLVTAIILFFIYAGYTERITVVGKVTSSKALTYIDANRNGYIKMLDVKVGDKVAENTILFYIKATSTNTEDTSYGSIKLHPVIASESGIVSAVLHREGSRIKKDQTVIVLRSEESVLQATVDVPAKSIRNIKIGTKAVIHYEAFPYQNFGHFNARVRDIETTLVSPIYDNKLPDSKERDSVYQVHLKLENEGVKINDTEFPLQIGMALNANLLLEYQYLYQWIFGPLLNKKDKTK